MRSSEGVALVATPQTPRGDRVVVLPLLKGSRGVLVDMEENRERPQQGVVVAVGPGGVGPETGRPITVSAKVGELVTYGRYAGLAFEASAPGSPRGAVDVIVMRDTEILLAQAPDTFELEMHDEDPGKVHLAGLTCDLCPRVGGEEGVMRLREIGRFDPAAPLQPEETVSPAQFIEGVSQGAYGADAQHQLERIESAIAPV